ncbi:hypothetical protein [Variovorax sp. JS1663]|uniref:hypothetical protein n=1 Tax=Variovorax sp. JS1663 TaxID=1851577 RepID=UPI000B3420D9|nr:hypothetical protein [Variovorax sp. JS1663]OUL99530.1 hypothetical protein A8M77_25850 [Variovorax sp. JS1663]
MKRFLMIVAALAVMVAALFVPLEADRTRFVNSAEIARPPAAVHASPSACGASRAASESARPVC